MMISSCSVPAWGRSYLDGSNVNKEFKRILKEAGLRDRRFHDLRHTCATRLFELGANPKEVQTYLGHASLAITMGTYTHVLNGQKKNIANRFDKMLESARI